VRARATAVFCWARSSASRRISFSKVFGRAAVAVHGPGSARRGIQRPDHLLAGAYRRQRAFGVEPPPAEQLIGGNAVPARDQRDRHPGRVGFLNDRCFLFHRTAPPTLNRRDHLNVLDLPSHSHRHTPDAKPRGTFCPVFYAAASIIISQSIQR
jgi:hypothetical protein